MRWTSFCPHTNWISPKLPAAHKMPRDLVVTDLLTLPEPKALSWILWRLWKRLQVTGLYFKKYSTLSCNSPSNPESCVNWSYLLLVYRPLRANLKSKYLRRGLYLKLPQDVSICVTTENNYKYQSNSRATDNLSTQSGFLRVLRHPDCNNCVGNSWNWSHVKPVQSVCSCLTVVRYPHMNFNNKSFIRLVNKTDFAIRC